MTSPPPPIPPPTPPHSSQSNQGARSDAHDSHEETCTAVIIGRAGSKGLPGKNALLLGDRPMIQHSILAAQAAESVDRILVSTDGGRIAEAAQALGVPVIERPAELSGDDVPVDVPVRHALEVTGDPAGWVVILYANVPIRPCGLIDRAVETLKTTGGDSVQSYVDVGKFHPGWMVELGTDGAVSPYEKNEIYRRQDLQPLFLPDGGVIGLTRESLGRIEPGSPSAFLGDRRFGILNAPGTVVDIDTAADLSWAEFLISNTVSDSKAQGCEHAVSGVGD